MKEHRSRRRSIRQTWYLMVQRCHNPKSADYYLYGGRGIRVCDRWRVFENFLADMGERPAGLSLDRIDNNGNYEPSNCRWATPRQQRWNNRQVCMLTHNGKTQPLGVWAKEIGMVHSALTGRLKKMSVEEALTKPKDPRFLGRSTRANGRPA